jgi:subtilisin-like proprotein convertase family protein
MTKKRSARTALLACAGLASLGLIAGAAPAAAKSKKKVVTKTATVTQCANQSVFVPDNSDPLIVVSAPVNFQVPNFRGAPQDGLVKSVNGVGVRITHTYAGDLGLYLVSPSGKSIRLTENADSSADGFGTGSQSCSGQLFGFSDSAGSLASDISSSTEDPLTGTFRPDEPLSSLANGPARGAWTLLAFDDSSGDEGTINAVSVDLTFTYKALKKVKQHKK